MRLSIIEKGHFPWFVYQFTLAYLRHNRKSLFLAFPPFYILHHKDKEMKGLLWIIFIYTKMNHLYCWLFVFNQLSKYQKDNLGSYESNTYFFK